MKNKIGKIKIRNKKFPIFLIFYILYLILSADFSFAQSSISERITSFAGEIRVNPDSSINVTENIQYDFGENQKHGIFRDIPVKYKARGGNFNLRISNIRVTDENGKSYNFKISYPGENVEIKIGDADKYVSGEKNYVINYTIRRAVNYFPDHDELYWNFTGDEWKIPIESASVKVILPENTKENLQAKCFEGVFGSTNECGASADGNILEYKSTKAYDAG